VRRVALSLKLTLPSLNKPVLLGVLNGCLPFFFSLLKALDLQTHLDWALVGANSPVLLTPPRDVIFVDDILHTGMTLKFLSSKLSELECTPHYVVLLRHRGVELPNIYSGIDLQRSTKWLVGFGLDWNNQFRNLNNIYELPEDYSPRGLSTGSTR